MSTIDKFIKKPRTQLPDKTKGKFEKFNLKENPFPANPMVNKESDDRRINGEIFEMQIREKEYNQIRNNFLKIPQSDLNHLRMGFILDTSYLGRGNGKSAFLINLLNEINKDYCLDLSDQNNKCFGVYFSPEPSGLTKTFFRFIDKLFQAIIDMNLIDESLASLRIAAIQELYPDLDIEEFFTSEEELVKNLNDSKWFDEKQSILKLDNIERHIERNKYLQTLPDTFPIFRYKNHFIFENDIVTQKEFEEVYKVLRNDREKLEFVFSYMVKFFQAAGFNGAYVLVDDFERVPDFQSTRQKRDFALSLRSCLFDGTYENAKVGFYNFLIVLHAGVPALIDDAWSESGMEHRVPIKSKVDYNHIIHFEKLSNEHSELLLKRYLLEYRTNNKETDRLYPFKSETVKKISEMSEYNASKILKLAYALLEKAVETKDQDVIDAKFFEDNYVMLEREIERNVTQGQNMEGTNLMNKAKGINE